MYNNYYNKNCCVEVELNTPEIEIDLEMGAKGDKGDSGASEWGDIGGTLSNQTDLNNALSGKQSTLVSGTNIKTINNESILGSGNINIQGGASTDVYTQEEQRIGTWIDGKPIYRQVINTTGDSSQNQTIATISNIDNIVNTFGWVKNGDVYRNCTTAYYGDTAWTSELYRNSEDINLECGPKFANFKKNATITLICEYTKITD